MTEQNQIRQTENQSTGPRGPTGGTRCGAERKERKPMVSWAALLDKAVKKPGFIHEAYTRFHNYSLGNQLLVLYQCFERALPLGPLASYRKWKELGRHVKKGEKSPDPVHAAYMQAHEDRSERRRNRAGRAIHFCCESLDLPGTEFSRGYIQSWGNGRAISERSAQRIFHAADQILRAGQPTASPSHEDEAKIKEPLCLRDTVRTSTVSPPFPTPSTGARERRVRPRSCLTTLQLIQTGVDLHIPHKVWQSASGASSLQPFNSRKSSLTPKAVRLLPSTNGCHNAGLSWSSLRATRVRRLADGVFTSGRF